MTAVLGIDACRAGWIGVRRSLDAAPTVHVGSDLASLLVLTGVVDAIGIDIPLHLPTDGPREAERLARRRLVGRASTVFNSPAASAVDAVTYAEANELNRAALGLGLSRQSFGLFGSIRDARDWLASGPDALVGEVHPELSFAAIARAVLRESKHTADGLRVRRELLESVGIALPERPPRGAAEDDLLDAGAASWTAARLLASTADRLPAEPSAEPPIWT